MGKFKISCPIRGNAGETEKFIFKLLQILMQAVVA